MENIINVAKFINDIVQLTKTITKNKKDFIRTDLLFDVNYYCCTVYKLIKMDCITLSHEFITEICGKPIKNNGYYIFYDILKENFVFLKGSIVKQLKHKNPKNISLLDFVNYDYSFILDMIYIENKLRKIPTIFSKFSSTDLEEIAKIISMHYNNLKEIIYTKQNNIQILLQTTYFIGNKDDVTFYQVHNKHLLLSIQLMLIQEFSNLQDNDDIKFIKHAEDIKKQILEKFNEYGLINTTEYFHIYQYNMLNGDEKSINIYVDFEFDELIKLLFFVDAVEIIDKI